MTYKFKCPACEHVVSAQAENDDEALEKIMTAGAQHIQEIHPDLPVTPEEEMKSLVKTSWWQE